MGTPLASKEILSSHERGRVSHMRFNNGGLVSQSMSEELKSMVELKRKMVEIKEKTMESIH